MRSFGMDLKKHVCGVLAECLRSKLDELILIIDENY